MHNMDKALHENVGLYQAKLFTNKGEAFMDINKAIKKQKNNYTTFFIVICLIFIILPIAVLLTGSITIFFLSYLAFIETFIIISCILISSNLKMKYSCTNNKLKIKSGWFGQENIILCDKVNLVHTEKHLDDMEIVILTAVKIKNKCFKPITKDFLKKYPLAAVEYKNIKTLHPDIRYYYIVIKKGGIKKYMLLDIIYRNCVKAVYTASSIDNIKIARGQMDI